MENLLATATLDVLHKLSTTTTALPDTPWLLTQFCGSAGALSEVMAPEELRFFWNTVASYARHPHQMCNRIKTQRCYGVTTIQLGGASMGEGERKERKKRTKDKKTFLRGQNVMVKMSSLISYHLHCFYG